MLNVVMDSADTVKEVEETGEAEGFRV